jgi:hypothetical protein
MLKEEFIIIRYSAQKLLDPFDLTYVDVLLSIGLQIFEKAADLDVKGTLDVDDEVLRHILDFTTKVVKDETFETKEGSSLSAGLKAFFGSVTAKISAQDTTRQKVRREMETRVTELLSSVELLAQELQVASAKRVLVIIEDLDKSDLDVARRLFKDHARQLTALPVSVIYTFPIALRHDDDFPQIRMNFSEAKTLPNIKPRHETARHFNPGLIFSSRLSHVASMRA